MMLGGSHFQIPPIEYAKKQGHYVITCDYLPGNPGHKYADEYHNISTTEKEKVLHLAKKLKIDGIIAYASDPSAPAAAYVAEKLALPTNPYKSVLLLTNKDMYRAFLEEHGFLTPKACGYDSLRIAEDAFDDFSVPVVVKPVDSSGSKGVTVIKDKCQLAQAYASAMEYSRVKRVILEEYVEKDGFQIAGDGFVYNGNLAFRCFANEHFDYSCNSLVPIGESFPYIGEYNVEEKIHDEIQRLMTLLDMKVGALNFDIRIGKVGEIYLMEIGPRNGGNLIPEVTRHVTNVDMIKYTVDAALDLDCGDLKMKPTKGYYSSYIVHSQKDGILKEIQFSPDIVPKIVFKDIWTLPGDKVKRFDGSNQTLGTMILKFESKDQMLDYMENMNQHVMVSTES